MVKHLKTERCRPAARDSEQGFILLMLMLFVALLAIAAAALAPTLAFQVRRDREEEMIHRGVQYSRAIRRYVKKTGRYPSRLEELENTNNLRFLRKRYKDPITGQDFKLLHVGEVQLTGGVGIAGASSIPGAATALGPGAAAAASMLSAAAQPGSMLGGTANPTLGTNPNQPASAGAAATTTAAAGATENSGQDASQMNSASPNQAKTEQSQSGSQDSKLSSQIFGGGPIVGVTSTSKAQSIREFNHKNHYNQWQFIYDPTMDRGGLIKTPAQPALQVTAPIQQQNSSNPSGGLQGSSPPPVQPVQPVQPQQQ